MANKKMPPREQGSFEPEAAASRPGPEPSPAEPLSSGALDRGDSGLIVVGLGASAGGLDAFRQFLTAVPDDTGMAFVLIQHLDPTHESLTAELLARHTRMSVVQVNDETRVEPNHVYVIPPKKYLTISGQTLQLTEQAERRGVRVPIDYFFRSLADDQQERSVGIVLSGTGSDGTLGVREIKAAGGMVMAQTPDSAQFDGMPRSAIAAGVVDYVLPVEEMPDVLVRYVRHRYVKGGIAPPPAAQNASDDLTSIIGLLRAWKTIDFSCYKKGTLTRRVERRMGLRHVETMGEYVAVLRKDTAEITALYKDLLIGVTNFFRDPPSWNELKQRVLEPLVANFGVARSGWQPAGGPEYGGEVSPRHSIRAWVAGCATGEEAYSLAMLLRETLQQADKGCDINIFASDIDRDALAFARAGIYPKSIAADVTSERLRRFFSKGSHTYQISKEIRESVVFAVHNVLSDPPFSKLDLLSCRNLLIYLEPEIQRKVLATFHFALRDGGFLFLGNAESITQQQDLFEPISRKWRIYRRVAATRREHVAPVKSISQPRTSLSMRRHYPNGRHLACLLRPSNWYCSGSLRPARWSTESWKSATCTDQSINTCNFPAASRHTT